MHDPQHQEDEMTHQQSLPSMTDAPDHKEVCEALWQCYVDWSDIVNAMDNDKPYTMEELLTAFNGHGMAVGVLMRLGRIPC
jgi:hypothetical protein